MWTTTTSYGEIKIKYTYKKTAKKKIIFISSE